ncbi:unnamed protein product [Cyclocybe aegerita]|uniref:Mediator of RNA polymerase II transcription subunit 19 n=1 Tax=Cyclocybe aegerita TaxID=1973307 RepID=A0A8S0WVY7_CYCAE|nr:unnamed protein product [Cyclocybe aegerita]
MNGHHSNAVAGPSTIRSPPPPPPLSSHSRNPSGSLSSTHPTPAPTFPLLFQPPPAPPPPRQHLHSTQDLLARFNLLPAYQKYVSSPLGILGESGLGDAHAGQTAATPDKGKGRDMGTGLGGAPTPAAGDVDMVDAHDADDDDAAGGKGEKKRKNTYKHLIQGVPGRHSFKKDDYLTTMMLMPPKQRVRIHRFDERTREEAFSVSLEGLKGWNVNTLVVESAQAREDRKKRKEAKRVAKLQAQAGQLPGATAGTPFSGPLTASTPIAHPQPIQAPIPTPASGASVRRMSTPQIGIPRAVVTGTPRPGSRAITTPTTNVVSAPPTTAANGQTVPRPTSTVPRPGSGVPRPGSTVPRPGSAVPRPGSQHQQPGAKLPNANNINASAGTNIVRSGTPMDVSTDQYGQRGKKREREEGPGVSANGVNGVRTNGTSYVNGNGVSNGHGVHQHQQRPIPMGVPTAGGAPAGGVAATAMNAKAGTGTIRPRPIKKQRVDVQGQARDVAPVQQPTPQGV